MHKSTTESAPLAPDLRGQAPDADQSSQFRWPSGFERIPDEDWTTAPLDPLGQRYASMATHRWYTNLELTRQQLKQALRPGHILVDYSGGTGILASHLVQDLPDVGIVIVDASPRFLRVALEKFRHEPRVAFRLLHPVNGEKRRLQGLDEAIGPILRERGVDGLVSTNAVHLYSELTETFRAWWRVLRPNAHVFVQSGDIRNPEGRPGEWLISEVVERVREVAKQIACEDPSYEQYRAVLSDPARLAAYDALWRKVFLPIRPVTTYRAALAEAGFMVGDTTTTSVDVGVLEWYEATSVYPDLLAFIGGSPRVDGRRPSPAEVQDQLRLLKQSFLETFPNRDVYQSTWTYLTAAR
jgi:ubiquinone/menaquinone biosynthesis C-methylase UbiE